MSSPTSWSAGRYEAVGERIAEQVVEQVVDVTSPYLVVSAAYRA